VIFRGRLLVRAAILVPPGRDINPLFRELLSH
jgi:hypothetical protein